MKIAEILTPEMVVAQLRGLTKAEVLTELAECLCKGHKEVSFERLLSVLNERERLGSTAIGDGIAIPHGKLRGITNILGVFGRSTGGVDFESLDGNPTHLFFLLVAPEDSASLHLKALARVSRLFKDAGFRQRLLDAGDGAELYRLLKEEDNKY
jgi:PTS system nitrogen regulatory IIA component